MVEIKICGITNLKDATAAIEAGADLLGFNFYRPSPRFIEPNDARVIIDQVRRNGASDVTAVGVFVNEDLDSVEQISSSTGIDMLQLHGDESQAYCAHLKSRIPTCYVIKALRVREGFAPATVNDYHVDAIMLDAFHDEIRGGTGRTIDWNVAGATRELVPRLFLSGGLSAQNVAEAIARVRPYAVDACSSLESSPGRKDAARMKEFVRAVLSS